MKFWGWHIEKSLIMIGSPWFILEDIHTGYRRWQILACTFHLFLRGSEGSVR